MVSLARGLTVVGLVAVSLFLPRGVAGSAPVWARDGMVVSQEGHASRIGHQVLLDGGSAIDAAVATAFALAVTHPIAGNIGGGGFIVYRPAFGSPQAYDFRETAPAGSSPEMWLRDGKYDFDRHHLCRVHLRRHQHQQYPNRDRRYERECRWR